MLIAMNEDDEHPPIEAEEKPYLQEYQDNDTLKRLWKECDMYERTLFPSISCPGMKPDKIGVMKNITD